MSTPPSKDVLDGDDLDIVGYVSAPPGPLHERARALVEVFARGSRFTFF